MNAVAVSLIGSSFGAEYRHLISKLAAGLVHVFRAYMTHASQLC